MQKNEESCGLKGWFQNKPGPIKAAQMVVTAAKQGNDVRKLLEMQQQMVWLH